MTEPEDRAVRRARHILWIDRGKTLWLAALAFLVSAPVVAQTWRVEQEEAVSLQYRDAQDEASLLEVHCTGSDSHVVVPAPTGIRDKKALRLDVTVGAATVTLQLPASVCGRVDGACVDRPAGEVSLYLLRRPGQELALRLAGATRVAISGGVTFAAEANPKAFSEFAHLCRKQRRIPAG